MGEEFYCILKLVSGEEIISLISLDDENNDDPLIILQNPIMIKIVEGPAGLMIKVKPWMELCEDDIYFIRMSKVMTMTEKGILLKISLILILLKLNHLLKWDMFLQ